MHSELLKTCDRSGSNSLKWTQYPQGVLPLWVADMDFKAPEPILEALRNQLEHGVLGYEFASPALRATVAARMQRLYGWKVDPDWVVATPGIVSGFTIAAWALCEAGQGILTQPPVYPPFLGVAGGANLVNQLAPLALERRDGVLAYRADLDSLRRAIHADGVRTGMFLLCNPHNPTGTVHTPAELRAMAELCLERDVPIVSDEIHSELMLGGTRHTPLASLSPEIERRAITLIAPSKTFNVPGLFCGFAIVADPELRQRFRQAEDRLTLHVSSLSLTAAEAAFSGACDPWLEALRAQLTENRDWLAAALRERLPGMAATVPQATYLAWLDGNGLGLGPASPYQFFLDQGRVALNDGREFGPGGEGFLRLNFGTTPDLLREGVDRMVSALARR